MLVILLLIAGFTLIIAAGIIVWSDHKDDITEVDKEYASLCEEHAQSWGKLTTNKDE